MGNISFIRKSVRVLTHVEIRAVEKITPRQLIDRLNFGFYSVNPNGTITDDHTKTVVATFDEIQTTADVEKDERFRLCRTESADTEQ